MSLLNFILKPDTAIIITDTLCSTPVTKEPYKFASKMFPIIHLHTVIAGTGTLQFILDWCKYIQEFVTASNINDLNICSPRELNKIAEKYSFNDTNCSTIFHFGYSRVDDLVKGFVYRSLNSFSSEEYQYDSTATKPPIHDIEIKTLEDMINVAQRQKENDELQRIEDRVGIGGELYCSLIDKSGIFMRKIYEYSDYRNMSQVISKRLKKKHGKG